MWIYSFQCPTNPKLFFDVEIRLLSQSVADATSVIRYDIFERINSGVLSDYATDARLYLSIESQIRPGAFTMRYEKEERVDTSISASESPKILSAKTNITIPHLQDGTSVLKFTYIQDVPKDIANWEFYVTLPPIPTKATVLTADNFTDENNPTITYSSPTPELIEKVEACISFTGAEDDITYREIPKTSGSYTFELTDAERNQLRILAKNTPSTTVRFYLKTTIEGITYFNYVDRELTIVNSNPVINNPRVIDIQPDILALTGDENTVVKYSSMAEFQYTPIGVKDAVIVSHYIKNGDRVIRDLNQGVIDNVESGLFTIVATDSRGFTTTLPIEKNFIDYVKPTCKQNVSIELVGETDAQINLNISGYYFNGSFGAVNNTLKIEVRHTQNDGTMGEWVDLTSGLVPVLNGNTYSLETVISGFDYSNAYTFQSRVTDKLNFVESSQYTVRALPVFDWGDSDFNFNVPVNINNPNSVAKLNMNDITVLRNVSGLTVLAGESAYLYIRPNGISNTDGQTVFHRSGIVDFSNELRINGEPMRGADYVVERGEEAMGSNGTWYWEKWNSGKAICYGIRNYGRLSCSTSVTGGYRNEEGIYQAFPTDLFINEFIVVTTDVSCISGEDDFSLSAARSSITSDGLYLYMVSSTRQTLSQSYISIYAVGRWQ